MNFEVWLTLWLVVKALVPRQAGLTGKFWSDCGTTVRVKTTVPKSQ
jgi:hypothetical protein